MRIRTLLLLTAFWLVSAAFEPAEAQVAGGGTSTDTGSGEGGREPFPRPPYRGPGDVVSGGGGSDEEEEDEILPGYIPPGPLPPPLVIDQPFNPGRIIVGAREIDASVLPPMAPDPVDWMPWWRFQRWQRMEAAIPEPNLAITPRDDDSRRLGPKRSKAPTADRALEILLAAWEGNPDKQEVRAALLISLARVGSGGSIHNLLVDALRDEDQRVVEAAALGLGILREPHAIPILNSIVLDSESGGKAIDRPRVPYRIRTFAAYGLGLIAQQTPYGPLRNSIKETLITGLRRNASPTSDLPVACVLALGLFPGEAAEELVPVLLDVLRQKGMPERVRSQVPGAVAKLLQSRGKGDALARQALEQIIKHLHGGNETKQVRQGCALALGRLGQLPSLVERATAALIEAAARDADPRAQHLALLGLAEIGCSANAAGQAKAIPFLVESMGRGSDIDRAWAALAMGWCAARANDASRPLPARAFERMLAAYPETARQRVRAALSIALGLGNYRGAAETLASGLEGVGDPVFRAEAVAGLALLGVEEQLPVVVDEWQTIDPFIEAYQSICASLARTAPDTLLNELLPALADTGARLQARFAAATGLGWMRDDRVLDPLAELLNEETNPFFVRAAAATSLGRVAERPGPRWNAAYLDLLNPYTAPPTLIGHALMPGVCDRL